MQSEIDFVLSSPIEYTNKGELVETNQIVLYAPTNDIKQDELKSRLRQGFVKSMFELQQKMKQTEETDAPTDGKMSGDTILMMLYASDIDIVAYKRLFRELIIAGAGKIDGITIGSNVYDRINTDDRDRMLGEYIAGFIPLSLAKPHGQK